MEKKTRNQGILSIGIIVIIIIFGGIIFAKMFYNSTQKRSLISLEETSKENIAVFQRELEKGKDIVSNLAMLLGQREEHNIEVLVNDIKPVDKSNKFKRMGIIQEDGTAYTTDNQQMELGDRDYFKRSVKGETVMSDILPDRVGGNDIIVYSAPITFSDGTRDVLFATQYIEHFSEALPELIFAGEGYTYVVKSTGEYIVGAGAGNNIGKFENIFDTLEKASVKNESSIKSLKDGLENNQQGYIIFRDNMEYYMHYEPVGVNGWYMLTTVPSKVMSSSMTGLLTLAYFFIVICAGAIILLVIQMGRIRQIGRKDLERIAFIDEATGYYNYARFKIEVKRILEENKDIEYAVVCFNLSKFQYINDLFGFDEGDNALRYVSETITRHLLPQEASARMMADHFVALLHNNVKVELKKRVVQIIDDLQKRTDFDGKHYELRATAGVYQLETNVVEIETMVDRAKMALIRPDKEVLEVCTFYDDEMRDKKIQIKEIEDRFEAALENKEFIVYYQPKYDIMNQRYDGAEALVRWKHPNNGLVSPGIFVPILENNGGIVQLDQYIFEEVCRQIREWLDEGYEVMPISVNISRLHLYRQNFVHSYLEIVEKYDIPVKLIQLELTETVLLANENILKGIMGELHKHGIWILMDDFGSGYSSLNTLKNIPIDVLKMDKCIIDDYDKNDKGRKIITSIVNLAKELNIRVVAEGVETKEQYDFLTSISCDYIQGYYCAKPVPTKEYVIFMKKKSSL